MLRWNTLANRLAFPTARIQPHRCLLLSGCRASLDMHFVQNTISLKKKSLVHQLRLRQREDPSE